MGLVDVGAATLFSTFQPVHIEEGTDAPGKSRYSLALNVMTEEPPHEWVSSRRTLKKTMSDACLSQKTAHSPGSKAVESSQTAVRAASAERSANGVVTPARTLQVSPTQV